MSKIFIKSGTNVRVADSADIETYDNLPAETYTVKFNEQADEFFLEQIENFDLPSKIYGTNTNYSERILNTFNDRSGGTGVILSGIKGAGKTLLAKQTAVAARTAGIPTIVINKDWHGDKFNAFIQSISTPSIIMFDEFEKVYDYQKQRKILTLLDGVYNSRKLFMLTTNTEDDVSEFLQNRPGRIFYNFTFDVLQPDFIQEFLEDRLDDKSKIASILDYAKVFSFFNFDMLSAIAEEMNRYGETLVEVLSVLNVKPENRQSDTYKIEAIIGDDTIVLDQNYNHFKPNSFSYMLWTDSDMPAGIRKNAKAKKLVTKMTKDGGDGEEYLQFNASLINRFEPDSSRFVYSIARNDESMELHVTRNDPLRKWKFSPNPNAL
jgi:hypothetical protein